MKKIIIYILWLCAIIIILCLAFDSRRRQRMFGMPYFGNNGIWWNFGKPWSFMDGDKNKPNDGWWDNQFDSNNMWPKRITWDKNKPNDGWPSPIFKFMWPKKENIQKAIKQIEKILPILEENNIETSSIKINLNQIKFSNQVAQNIITLWLATGNRDIKKYIWDKLFELHKETMENLWEIRNSIKSQIKTNTQLSWNNE